MSSDGELQISEERRQQYTGLYLLYELGKDRARPSAFPVDLDPEVKFLEAIFSWLLEQEYLYISPECCYEISEKGRDVLAQFMQRYHQFLKEFDVFCAVDLEQGEFAFEYYEEFADRSHWQAFLEEERWDDLRIAVAEYKGWDFIEIIFMSLLSEPGFGDGAEHTFSRQWLSSGIWDEIHSIAASAIRMKTLAYEEDGELISGQQILNDIYTQGQELLAQYS